MRTLKILFTTHQGGIAGSTYSVFALAKGLARMGHEIHVAGKPGTLLSELIAQEANIHFDPIKFDGYLDGRSVRLLAKVIRRNGIEIVNAQSGHDRTLAILAKWIYRLPVKLVFTRRQRPRNEPFIKRWFHIFGSEKIIVISEGLKEMFINKGYPESHLKVINNGLPPFGHVSQEETKALQEKLRNGPVIGCVARLKSQDQLLSACKYLPEDCLILFVGVELKQLQKHVDEIRPKQKLIFTGRVSRREALRYMSVMDVNILPSVMDGFGLVLVEAMQLGVPVIGTNRGGIKSVIEDGKSGLLFQDGDAEGLARSIMKVLQDKPLKEYLIKNGYKRAEHFSIQQTVAEYSVFFHSLFRN